MREKRLWREFHGFPFGPGRLGGIYSPRRTLLFMYFFLAGNADAGLEARKT